MPALDDFAKGLVKETGKTVAIAIVVFVFAYFVKNIVPDDFWRRSIEWKVSLSYEDLSVMLGDYSPIDG